MATAARGRTRKQPATQQKVLLPKRPTKIEEWFEAKIKEPSMFKTNEDGNLVVPPYKEGESEIIFEIHPKVEASTQHIKAEFESYREELKEPEEEFTRLKRELHDVLRLYHSDQATVQDVLDANHAVNVAQCKLNSLYKKTRTFTILNGLLDQDLSFDWYRRKKIVEPVSMTHYGIFPWKAFWTQQGDIIPDISESDDYEETQEESNDQSGGATAKKAPLTVQQRAIIANYRKKRAAGGHF